jgi:hypothetical protein
MLLYKRVCLALGCLFMTSCASSARESSTVTLVMPESFRGEIYITENKKTGQDWKKGDVVVPASGIAAVNDLAGLATIAPDAFRAKYSNGKKLGNSVLRTGKEVSLWPVTYLKNELLYFVVGTWDEKTDRDNEKMNGDWKKVIASIKAGSAKPTGTGPQK